jgi:hypothetical protein
MVSKINHGIQKVEEALHEANKIVFVFDMFDGTYKTTSGELLTLEQLRKNMHPDAILLIWDFPIPEKKEG